MTPAVRGRRSLAARWNAGRRLLRRVRLSPDVMGLSIADVAGKGLPAALLMSSLQAAVRAFAHDASPPSAVCASVNRLLCGQMIAGRFVTMAYLRLDAARGTVVYANAGHNPPLLARRNGLVTPLGSSGMVLGVFPDAEYLESRTATRRVAIDSSCTPTASPKREASTTKSLARSACRRRCCEIGI